MSHDTYLNYCKHLKGIGSVFLAQIVKNKKGNDRGDYEMSVHLFHGRMPWEHWVSLEPSPARFPLVDDVSGLPVINRHCH